MDFADLGELGDFPELELADFGVFGDLLVFDDLLDFEDLLDLLVFAVLLDLLDFAVFGDDFGVGTLSSQVGPVHLLVQSQV